MSLSYFISQVDSCKRSWLVMLKKSNLPSRHLEQHSLWVSWGDSCIASQGVGGAHYTCIAASSYLTSLMFVLHLTDAAVLVQNISKRIALCPLPTVLIVFTHTEQCTTVIPAMANESNLMPQKCLLPELPATGLDISIFYCYSEFGCTSHFISHLMKPCVDMT